MRCLDIETTLLHYKVISASYNYIIFIIEMEGLPMPPSPQKPASWCTGNFHNLTSHQKNKAEPATSLALALASSAGKGTSCIVIQKLQATGYLGHTCTHTSCFHGVADFFFFENKIIIMQSSPKLKNEMHCNNYCTSNVIWNS